MIEQKIADQNCIFKCIAGSHAYGTNIESSDEDRRGVFIAPPDYILSCFKSVEQVQVPGEDTVLFELKKFINLAANCNPNIIELLFTDEKNIIFATNEWKQISDNRHLFLSKKAKHTFAGYAASQLARIKGHKKWIMKPQPEDPPKLSDFCKLIASDGTIITDGEKIREISRTAFAAETFGTTHFRIFQSPQFFAEKLGFFDKLDLQIKTVNVHDDILKERATYIGFLFVNINEFKSKHKEWRQYWEWKKNRNPQRAKLEEEYGFDGKHALHLVRLMKMAKEILTEQTVTVYRPDAKELLDIRLGNVDYDDIINWAEQTDKELEQLYKTSKLRERADYEAIDKLYRDIVGTFWRES